MAVKYMTSIRHEHDGETFHEHRLLATELCAAFSTGRLGAGSRLALRTLFPGCRLMRVQLPVAAPSRGLLSAGNMATEGVRPLRSITPLSLAAAGMALCERRWFHVARSAAPGLCKYRDLSEAFGKLGCESVVFVPILPELPSWAAPPANLAGSNGARPLPVLPAFGVLTLGVDDSTVVDARLLTSLFLVAHLVAQHLVHRGPVLLSMRRSLSLSETGQHAHSQHPVSSSNARGDVCIGPGADSQQSGDGGAKSGEVTGSNSLVMC